LHNNVIIIFVSLQFTLFYSYLYYYTFSLKPPRFQGVKCGWSVYLHGIQPADSPHSQFTVVNEVNRPRKPQKTHNPFVETHAVNFLL